MAQDPGSESYGVLKLCWKDELASHVPCVLPQDVPPLSHELQAFCADLGARLRAGSHLILYGPRGAGKSTLLRVLGDHYGATGVPWGLVLCTDTEIATRESRRGPRMRRSRVG